MLEQPTWTQVALAPAIIGARFRFGSAYDSDRKHLVVFGGQVASGATPNAETWEWDGARWTQRPVPSPPARVWHMMAYDRARHVTLLYGGTTDATPFAEFGDTWEWDGATWTQVFPTHSPGIRYDAGMAYDEQRGVVVLFGGEAETGTVGDTWEWDGTDWTQRATTGPGVGFGVEMTYDARIGKVIQHRIDNTSNGSQLWSWDGSAWTREAIAGPPPGFAGGPMAYDRARDVLVFAYGDRTFESDGVNVTEHDPYPYPSLQERAQLFDTDDGVVTYAGVLDAWIWNGTDWRLSETDAPAPREGATMATDVARGQVVLFGGMPRQNLMTIADTWTWDTKWTLQHPAHQPSPRYEASMAYDSIRRRVMLFGGFEPQSDVVFNDLWAWDGTDWTLIETIHNPPGGGSIAYDRDADVLTLVDPVTLGTWDYDGIDWHRRTDSPNISGVGVAAYDPPSRSVMLAVGGHRFTWNGTKWAIDDNLFELFAKVLVEDQVRLRPVLMDGDLFQWEWNGLQWVKLVTAGTPPSRTDAAYAFDARADQILMFGGAFGSDERADTWAFAWRSATPIEQCDGTDADGDGLVDCADPDCWWSCTPTCPPLASCP